MKIKKCIKCILGPKGTNIFRNIKAQSKYFYCKCVGWTRTIKVHGEEWSDPVVFAQPKKHVFFGYYDLQQLNEKKDKMLVTVLPKYADTKKDKAELGWYNLRDGQYHSVATTDAWCWQQGARLRWHPTKTDMILYNDVEKDQYVTYVCHLKTGEKTLLAKRACYDVTSNLEYGLALNFSRLQRLRPGYGYSKLPDRTLIEKVPKEDGIFLVDLQRDESKLIISYEQLTKLSPGSEREWNYLNHISIAPDGNKFMFFHLWTHGIGEMWQAKLYIADMDGSNLRCLEEKYITSHYCWKGSHELLTTTVEVNGERSHYFIYDVDNGRRTELQSQYLHHDGHPSCLCESGYFITDTYPLENCMQHIFSESIDKSEYSPICDLFSDPRMYGEKRCDLHPRVTKDNMILTVDSTFRDETRKVLLFRKKV